MKTFTDGLVLRVSTENGEVRVRGNDKGLTYLGDICRQIIGKTDPSGHIHIDPKMGNASEGSQPMIVEFTEGMEE